MFQFTPKEKDNQSIELPLDAESNNDPFVINSEEETQFDIMDWWEIKDMSVPPPF